MVELDELETELTDEVAEITQRWSDVAEDVTEITVGLEANDVKVVQLSLTWLPVT